MPYDGKSFIHVGFAIKNINDVFGLPKKNVSKINDFDIFLSGRHIFKYKNHVISAVRLIFKNLSNEIGIILLQTAENVAKIVEMPKTKKYQE